MSSVPTGPAPLPLLPTKLFVPIPDADVLERAHLLERLGAARGARMLLVSAPAGSGKTTLVADWVRRAETPTAWLSLDGEDDDPASFLRYLVEALGQLGDAVCERTRALLASGSPPAARIL